MTVARALKIAVPIAVTGYLLAAAIVVLDNTVGPDGQPSPRSIARSMPGV